MGLVLQDPSDPLSYSNRYLPGNRDPHSNPRARHPRRPFAWSQAKTFKHHDQLTYPDVYGVTDPRPHHITLFNALAARHRDPHHPGDATQSARHRRKPRYWDDAAEGVEIACSELKLPGDSARRPPSLERQNAFRDARTAKKMKRSFAQQALAADDAELYRLGVLYDDEYERGDGFSLDAIQRDMPFSVTVKQSKKRGRKERREEDYALDLALSFAALGDDEALAAFLMGPAEDELEFAELGAEHTQGKTRKAEQGLTIVYELEDDEEDHDWAFLDGSRLKKEEEEEDGSDDAGTDAWIMLGGDGS
ncbi:hypothetical protein OQA88_695 [Cercophora sp. LCS_1]